MYDLQIAASLPITDTLDSSFARVSESGFPAFEIGEDFPLDDSSLATFRALCYRHQIAALSAFRRIHSPSGEPVFSDALRADSDALDSLGAEYLLLSSSFNAVISTEEDAILGISGYCEQIGLKCSRIVFPGYSSKSDDLRDIRLAFDFTRVEASPASIRLLFQDYGSRCDYLRLPLRLSDSPQALKALEESLEESDFTGWAVFVGTEGDDAPERFSTAFQIMRDRFSL